MKELEAEIRQYLTERGWDNLKPSNLAKSISIEAAELLELFQWNNQELDEVKQDTAKLANIKKELADVLIYALDMAVLLNLDTKQIILDKLDEVKKKYPADLMKKTTRPGSGSGNDPHYLAIKEQYRSDTE